MTDTNIRPYTNGIVDRMFFETADLNYIGARSAFFDERDWDFWWLSLHAAEKYLKCILLFNGGSAKGGGHDIVKLLDAVRRLDSRLQPAPFYRPNIRGLDHWADYPDQKFFERLNDYGSADNRYGTYGHVTRADDLFRVDQFIYWARRHARQFSQAQINEDNFDWVEALRASPDHWIQHRGPLEKIAAGSPRDRKRWMLARLNTPFFPRSRHEIKSWRSSSTNPPIADWCHRLEGNGAGTDGRRTARAVLQWVIDNIQLSKEDKRELIELLLKNPEY